mmetsp:Transcript_42261/g.49388  ORF Transcript_42261/g.49388 Transcript_42261/m.49388 type:complete len:81 (+) Transcript_42261:292-534(+)
MLAQDIFNLDKSVQEMIFRSIQLAKYCNFRSKVNKVYSATIIPSKVTKDEIFGRHCGFPGAGTYCFFMFQGGSDLIQEHT